MAFPTEWTRDLAALEAEIRERLGDPLPGGDAQVRMAPRPRPGWKPGVFPKGERDGAALLLLYPHAGSVHLLLTLRSRHLPTHRGQVSLPGGMVEDGEIPVGTALREAEEETGVDPSRVRILGELTPVHIPVSGFILHPVVGVCDVRPELRADPTEVERILEVPLAALADPARLEVERRRLMDVPRNRADLGHLEGEREIPFFRLAGEKVWGATAIVLAEFLDLLGAPPDPWGDPGATA